MMNRPYLFMSGEFAASMPAVFSNELWEHTMTPDKLLFENYLRRSLRPREELKGVIHYADVLSKKLEEDNLKTIIENNIPCWPDPNTLLRMLDRHSVLKECVQAGFVNHNVYQIRNFNYEMIYPFVLKTGNFHRGEGKFLINSYEDLPDWEGIASIEPFFIGESVRVLIIEDDFFGIKMENDSSWIKNSAGAEIYEYELSNEIKTHAKQVKDYFNLDIAGIDYIVNKDIFHFLEVNQYPGVGSFDYITSRAKQFFINKMKLVESL